MDKCIFKYISGRINFVMENLTMSQLLFPSIDKTPADYEAEYPPRELADGAKVTRFAPSPTGFLHFGSLFAAFIAAKTAGSDGVFLFKDRGYR